MQMEVMKPRGPAGVTCPLVKKECSAACQTCMFWIGMPMEKGTEWNCAVNWAALSGPILTRRLHAIHDATIEQRNDFGGFRDSIMKLIGVLGRVMIPSRRQEPIQLESSDDGAQKLIGP
jgi:hypothetical protein